ALNLIDPKNWRERTVQTKDGPTEVQEYVPPDAETQHLQPLQDELRERQANDAMDASIRIALNDSNRSSPVFAAAAIGWAQKQPTSPKKDQVEGEGGGDDHRRSMREETIVTAAMIAARDGNAELIVKHEKWTRDTLLRGLKGKSDSVHRVRSGLQFNPIAIAFVGMVLLLKKRFTMEDARILLESAGDDNPAAAHGFAASAGVLAEIDERLPRAVLRCAFAARVKPHREWRKPEVEHIARAKVYRRKTEAAIDAEMSWLAGKRDEPSWPEFPPKPARPRQRFVSAKRRQKIPLEEPPEPDVYIDYQAAAMWLGSAAGLFDVAKRPWLRDIVKTYASWTFVANGSKLEEDEDTDSGPREWNDAFFKLLASCLPGLTAAQIDEIALAPIAALPEHAFLDAAAAFLRDADGIYFNDLTLQEAEAAHVRSSLAKRLMTTRVWERHVRDRAKSIEIHFGPALAVVLLNDYGHFQPAKCYLNPRGIDRVEPFLPGLREVATAGPFLLVAICVLNLVEVVPRAAHLPPIVEVGKSWLAANPDDREFWIDHGIGRRLCTAMEAILALDPKLFGPDQALRKDIDGLLASLVRMGIAEANRLEECLNLLQSSHESTWSFSTTLPAES